MANSQVKAQNPLAPQALGATVTASYELRDPVQVNQIYTLVNNVFHQMTGRDDISVVDTASLVAMGDEIANLEAGALYLSNLSRRIGLTIDGYRIYSNDFSDFKRDSFEYGAAVQKLYVHMPDAVEDDAYDVGKMDGQSVDHYIISNPKVEQKIFDVVTPYSFFITIQDWLLTEAFLSSGQMYGLINTIFGQVQNKMEAVHEDLGRMALANLAVNMGSGQQYHLVSIYNARTGKTITPQEALYDDAFLRFAIGFINNISRKMRKMSVVFNAEGKVRFTPESKQSLFVLSDFETQLETVTQYAAFHDNYVQLRKYISIPYWQAVKDGTQINQWDTLSTIKATKNASGVKTPVTMNNVIGMLVDWESFGTFRNLKKVATTPVNARALYYNTFWHERQMWFNDLSENAVVFLLD